MKQLIDLHAEAKKPNANKAAIYLEIAHAYYNCTYWGNAWMMTKYGWSSMPDGNAWSDMTEFNASDKPVKSQEINNIYYNCSLAFEYYQKVTEHTNNPELLAAASFMKHCCDYNRFLYSQSKLPWDEQSDDYNPVYISDLYTNYNNTETFKTVRCSKLDDFANEAGVR